MSPPDKNALLADEILKIIRKGLTLSRDVVHYIDSTFSNPGIEELEAILEDGAVRLHMSVHYPSGSKLPFSGEAVAGDGGHTLRLMVSKKEA